VSNIVTELRALKSTKKLNFGFPSGLFLSTEMAGAAQGELLSLITPLSNIFFTCAFISPHSE
jgi:hypothetical protein